MDDDEIDIEGDDDDMGIGNDRSSIPHHRVHTSSDSFLSELPETSSWILDSFGDWNVDEDQKSKDIHSMLQEEEYYFHRQTLDAPSSNKHPSPAKHAHAHHTLVHNSPFSDNSPDKSDLSKPNKKSRRKIALESEDEDGSEEGGGNSASRKGEAGKKARATWSAEEERLFREAISKYGRNYRKVQVHVGTRTIGQVRSHAQKYFQKQKVADPSPTSSSSSPAPALTLVPITSTTSSSAPTTPSGSPSPEAAPHPASSSAQQGNLSGSGSHAVLGSQNPLAGSGSHPPPASAKHLPSHNTPWTQEEQKAFAEGLGMYGKGNWKLISSHIGSRTPLQVKNHARQYFKKMARLGVEVDVEPKPKVEKVEKKKKEPEPPQH